MDLTAEERRLRDARTNPEWRLWGPYLERAPVGAPSGRTTARAATPGTTSPTTRPARAPTAGARTAWPAVRRPAADVLRHRPLERAGRHRQGAAVRPHQLRGQPRRGREGVLLLPRQRAHALLPALAVQVPPGGVPLRGPGADEPLARPAWSRSTSCSTLGCSTRVGTSTSRSSTRRPAPRPGLPHHRRQPGPGRRAAPPAADAVVPQHLVLAAEQLAPPPAPGRGATTRAVLAEHEALGDVRPPRRGPGRPPVLRERDQH